MATTRVISRDEVKNHNKESDAWMVINGKVFDVTKFLSLHPGGKKVLLNEAGSDASAKFAMFHKPTVLEKYESKLQIGVVSDSKPPAPKKEEKKAAATAVPASSAAKGGALTLIAPSTFGDMETPFSDPSWYKGWHSTYFTASHIRLRSAMRAFVEKEIIPYCNEWDEAKKIDTRIFKKAADAGWLAGVVGPPWQEKYVGRKIIGDVTPEEYDSFHELIIFDEVSRCGSGGAVWGIFGGLSIGLPPIIKFGSKFLQDKCVAPCLKGEKFICLAITEPSAGSDVANISATAKKTEDGKFYIVNGEKKWITNGIFADFFTVAVRTGGSGMGGISLLLIEKTMPGVTARQMQCSGVWSSGTTYLTFEDVKVPVENLIGKENEGFKCIMFNFNHERWSICIQTIRFSRVLLEEALKYAFKRRTFGKLLIEHPVIRMKLAHMARHVEASTAWLESITLQMKLMSKAETDAKLGGPVALLKAQATQTMEFCAREAAQIFGGLAYSRGGQGEKVERLYREVRAMSIPGGSEEIMLDLGIRQSVKDKIPAPKGKSKL